MRRRSHLLDQPAMMRCPGSQAHVMAHAGPLTGHHYKANRLMTCVWGIA
jgi:hypothetical protein